MKCLLCDINPAMREAWEKELERRPRLAAVMPFPKPETTPPVTKINLANSNSLLVSVIRLPCPQTR